MIMWELCNPFIVCHTSVVPLFDVFLTQLSIGPGEFIAIEAQVNDLPTRSNWWQMWYIGIKRLNTFFFLVIQDDIEISSN